MPLQATEGGNDAASIISNVLGIGPGAPPSASSPPSTAVSAPTISTGSPAFSSQTPVPGQGIALDVNGKLPQTLLNEMLQLLNPANRKVVFGTGSTTFPGGSNTANNALVTHNLNVVPVFIVVQPGLSGAAAVFVPDHARWIERLVKWFVLGGRPRLDDDVVDAKARSVTVIE